MNLHHSGAIIKCRFDLFSMESLISKIEEDHPAMLLSKFTLQVPSKPKLFIIIIETIDFSFWGKYYDFPKIWCFLLALCAKKTRRTTQKKENLKFDTKFKWIIMRHK